MTVSHSANLAPVLERLKAALGSYGRVAAALAVEANYLTRWRKLGYIPEIWALDVEGLNVTDAHGRIDSRAVLVEARAARWANEQKKRAATVGPGPAPA